MSEAEVIDAEEVDIDNPEARALAVRNPGALAVAPEVNADDLVARLDVIREAMQKAMVADIDYGVIPGTSGKPTLLKPGAEKLAVLFQLDLQPENEKIWHEDGHLTVISTCTVYHAPSGARLGKGEGVCSTREKKYAYRRGTLSCPACGKESVFKSKHGRDEFYCWVKKGGCGRMFPAGSDEYAALAATNLEDVPNPDLADTYNTVVKMAMKRGRIDAVLAVTGASALFTQDMEDAKEMPGNNPSPPGGDEKTTADPVQAGGEKAEGSPGVKTKPPAGSQWGKDVKNIHRMHRLLEAQGLSAEQYRAQIKANYGTEHVSELTERQAADLVKRLRSACEQLGVE